MLTFDFLMKCRDNCDKCSGKCLIWVHSVEKGKRLYRSHFLIEDDKTKKPYVLKSCYDCVSKYKTAFDKMSKMKTSGWHAFLFPSDGLAKVVHDALDAGFGYDDMCRTFEGIKEFEV